MAWDKTIVLAGITLLGAASPAAAQQLENSQTAATSGTVGTSMQGRSSGANLSAGGKGPASGTQMEPPNRQTNGREIGAAQAGADSLTKELYEH